MTGKGSFGISIAHSEHSLNRPVIALINRRVSIQSRDLNPPTRNGRVLRPLKYSTASYRMLPGSPGGSC